MQAKTIMRYHRSSVRRLSLKGQEISAIKDVEKGNPQTLLVGM